MFSVFTEWISSAADAVNKISDQGLDAVRNAGLIDALQGTVPEASSATATASTDKAEGQQQQQLAVADLMNPPATWKGSSGEWQWCMKAALNDVNTCAITPVMLKSDDNLWKEIHSLMTELDKSVAAAAATDSTATSATSSEELLNNVGGTYAPAADLVAFIQAHMDIYSVRSYVVPLFTSDENYWLNLGWRLALYRRCVNANDLFTVMRTLSKLPARLHNIAEAVRHAAEAAAAQHAVKTAAAADDDDDEEEAYVERPHLRDNSAYWNEKKRQYEAEQAKFAWLRETQDRVKKEVELARENAKLLDSLLQRQEASSALGVSVYDSCKYHKVKLSRLIGDVCAAPDENTNGTVLDTTSGPLFLELFQCNEDVKNVLHAYAGRSQEGDSSTGSSPKAVAAPATSSTSTSLPPPAATTASEASASPPQPVEVHSITSSSAVELSAAGSVSHRSATAKRDYSGGDDEGSFEAKLPWSMDD